MPVYRYAGSGDIVYSFDIDRSYREGRMSSSSKRDYETRKGWEENRRIEIELIAKSARINQISLPDEPPVIIQPTIYSPTIKDEPFIDPTRDMFKFYKL